MKRRDFLKVSGAATAGLALTGCLPGRESKTASATPLENEQKKLYKDRISRDVSPYDPLYLNEITVNIGLKEPFDVMHVSDSHIARADDRDGERTIKLAASRSRGMNAGEHYLDEAVNIARKKGMHLMHLLEHFLHLGTLLEVHFDEIVEGFSQMLYCPGFSYLTCSSE